ncbi:YciI family protein [Corynebacterium tapiri]|uniref:YCII-related domain-containing protein n=1 Tax=Corynebacterium tapiri TaxID=1448266 RepID=A0A5C4U592_9CORY|nr:YciI family protein [Corynebacterium tapiri]TNL99248.1 hypothetical protein FHE74_02515 [Corynebacterium tapiri]
MTYFSCVYRYPDGDENIVRLRPVHREFLASLKEDGKLIASGPLTGGDALIVLQLPGEATVADAEQLMDQDPFTQEGVLHGREIRPWNPVINVWEN